jgi:CHAT domain-containing protein
MQFLDTLRVTYPNYFDFLYRTQVMSADELRNQGILSTASVLAYFMGGNHTYAILISQNRSVFRRISTTDSLNALITKVLSDIRARPSLRKDESQTNRYMQLSSLLLNDLLPENEDNVLYIIPDGSLSFVPFEALMINTQKYLISGYPVAYAYSMTILKRQMTDRGHNHNREFIAFAPYTDKQSASFLRHSVKELNALKGFKGLVLRGFNATLDRFTKDGAGSGLIHLSTHATADSPEPSIAFFDSTLSLSAVYGLSIHSDLVLLSACETNVGEEMKGEGVMSLSRGFTFAGARSITSSLWKVNDAATASIVAGFYSYLRKEVDPVRALQQAKLSYLGKRGSAISTYYWAALVYYGPDLPISIQSTNRHTYIYATILLSLFVASFIYWMRRYKSKSRRRIL